MLSVLVIDPLWRDKMSISRVIDTASARHQLPIRHLVVWRELKTVDESALSDFNAVFIALPKLSQAEVKYAQGIRCIREHIFVVIVVGQEADISLCVRPSVRPAGILFIPLEPLRVYQTIRELHQENMRMASSGEQPVYTVRAGSNHFRVKTGDISFFEARGKKIALRTRGQEVLFYSSFESVLNELPGHFTRCHKGFVVNTHRIRGVSFALMELTMDDDSVIPVSRTYRDNIKAMLSKEV